MLCLVGPNCNIYSFTFYINQRKYTYFYIAYIFDESVILSSDGVLLLKTLVQPRPQTTDMSQTNE